MDDRVKRFLDNEGKVKQLPAKMSVRNLVYDYLGEKFEADKVYSETDVNEIVGKWSVMEDYFLLRRGLIEAKILSRTPDGREYWKNPVDQGSEQES